MSTGMLTAILVALALSAIGVIVAWRYGSRLKQKLDHPVQPAPTTREVLAISPDAAAALRLLTSEPILLKMSEGGLRFQIDNRPMVTTAALAGQPAHWAVAESAAAITRCFGAQWVALVQPTADDEVTVQRLA